jgi:hypothetical protein
MPKLEETLLSVWRQVLVENLKVITVADDTFNVRSTAEQELKQVDFRFQGRDWRGLQQNPYTKSRWAAKARSGARVMQFLEAGKYIAVVVDGKAHLYSPKK